MLREGQELVGAIDAARLPLEQQGAAAEEVLHAIDAAVALAKTPGDLAAERLATLGEGWVAEEALAIALYCAMVAHDFEHGFKLAVNHSGDSDSRGRWRATCLASSTDPARYRVDGCSTWN